MDHPEPSGVNRRGKRPPQARGDGVAKSTREGASSGPATTIRPAVPADLAALLALEAGFPGDRLSRQALRQHLAAGRALCLVAEAEGQLLGYVLVLRRTGSRWWRVYSLIRAAAAPPGTGRRLLEAVIAAARQAAAAGLRLEVRADNTPAIRLYEALGFTLFATRDGYYEDGAKALRMALAFAA